MSPICVWGAGAIGGTLGAAFLRAGRDVVFVDSAADHVAAINASGLTIEGPLFADTVHAPAFLPDAVAETFDLVVLAVKAHHTEGAATALAPQLSADGAVVSAQNGLNERVIAGIVGEARTIGAFVNFGADYLAPGVVHYSGRGAVVVGELNGRPTPRIKALHALMRQFEPAAILTDNIDGFLWGKLVYGTLLFATALTNDSIADVLGDPAARPLLTALGMEVGAVAVAAGVRPEPFDGFDPLAFVPGAPPERTERSFADLVAHNRRSLKTHTGIWRDLAIRKRRTEVDAQLGPIVEFGALHGVPTPLTARTIALIHAIEDGTRPLSRETLAAVAGAA